MALTKQQLKFFHVDSLATADKVAGGIYFVDNATRLGEDGGSAAHGDLYIYNGSEFEKYTAQVDNVTIASTGSPAAETLTIAYKDGSTKTIDLASQAELDKLKEYIDDELANKADKVVDGIKGNIVTLGEGGNIADGGVTLGEGKLETTAQTIVGAINEVKAEANAAFIDAQFVKSAEKDDVDGDTNANSSVDLKFTKNDESEDSVTIEGGKGVDISVNEAGNLVIETTNDVFSAGDGINITENGEIKVNFNEFAGLIFGNVQEGAPEGTTRPLEVNLAEKGGLDFNNGAIEVSVSEVENNLLVNNEGKLEVLVDTEGGLAINDDNKIKINTGNGLNIDENGALEIDPASVDGTLNAEIGEGDDKYINKLATLQTVKNAVNGLDVENVAIVTKETIESDTAAYKQTYTFNGVKEVDGKIETGTTGEILYVQTAQGENNPLITKADIAAIEGALVWKGVVTKEGEETDEQALARKFPTPENGWVAAVGIKEYVYNEEAGKWQELGDESATVNSLNGGTGALTIQGKNSGTEGKPVEYITIGESVSGVIDVDLTEGAKTSLGYADKSVQSVTLSDGTLSYTTATDEDSVKIGDVITSVETPIGEDYIAVSSEKGAVKISTTEELQTAIDTANAGVKSVVDDKKGNITVTTVDANGATTTDTITAVKEVQINGADASVEGVVNIIAGGSDDTKYVAETNPIATIADITAANYNGEDALVVDNTTKVISINVSSATDNALKVVTEGESAVKVLKVGMAGNLGDSTNSELGAVKGTGYSTEVDQETGAMELVWASWTHKTTEDNA